MANNITEFDAEPAGGLDARFCEVMDAAPVMIWVSGLDKLCVWFNQPWLTFTGRSMAQEIGDGWAQGVHLDDLNRCLEMYIRHFDARKQFRMQYRLRRHNGAYRWIDDAGIPRYARNGAFLGYIGSCTDIHEHRETQGELRRRLLEISHLNRRADAAALAASIAHELNQPLAAILSNVEAAEIYLEAPDPKLTLVKDILADIRRDDHRAAQVIRHMRELLRKDEIELQTVDLNEAVRVVHEILKPQATDMGCVFSLEHRQNVLPVHADPIYLQQVVLNLALNGMDAVTNSPKGQREVIFQTDRAGEFTATVSVSDSGGGIPAERLEGIFEPFFTTKKRGSGLGLSISRGIIEALGGKLWAENRAGGGAVFHFTLPLAPGQI
jgi:PAS domain S-box-containing protein